jgi:hypothetical protein
VATAKTAERRNRANKGNDSSDRNDWNSRNSGERQERQERQERNREAARDVRAAEKQVELRDGAPQKPAEYGHWPLMGISRKAGAPFFPYRGLRSAECNGGLRGDRPVEESSRSLSCSF